MTSQMQIELSRMLMGGDAKLEIVRSWTGFNKYCLRSKYHQHFMYLMSYNEETYESQSMVWDNTFIPLRVPRYTLERATEIQGIYNARVDEMKKVLYENMANNIAGLELGCTIRQATQALVSLATASQKVGSGLSGVIDELNDEGTEVYLDDDMQSEIAGGGSYLPADWKATANMRDTEMKTPIELDILQYILRGDKNRIKNRAYNLDNLPPTLEVLHYVRKDDEGTMEENRTFARKLFQRHGMVLTQFKRADSYTFNSEPCITMHWRKRK